MSFLSDSKKSYFQSNERESRFGAAGGGYRRGRECVAMIGSHESCLI